MRGKRAYKNVNSKNVGMKILMITVVALLLSVVLASSAGAQTNIGGISGYKINDTNGNGRWDVGETGIPGWHIRLIGIAGTGLDIRVVRKETFTDAQGFYKFDDLPVGRYIIIETIQRGWIPTSSIIKNIKLTAGENSININFTNRLLRILPTPTPTPIPTPAPPLGAPNITSFSPPSPVSDVIGASRTFSITVNQTVSVSWQFNGKEVFNQTGVTQSTYANNSAALGTWNITATATNANGTVSQKWTWIVTAGTAGAPSIVSFMPPSPVRDTVGATRAFNITANQTVNAIWYINGIQVQFNESVSNAMYTNTSAAKGIWNISAVAVNANGSDIHTWIWNVTTQVSGEPSITSFAPASPVNDTIGATRTFNITVNQTVNVTWYINGTEVFNQTDVDESNYTNTSASLGIWNITAIANNSKGTAMQTWIWNVTSPILTPFSPAIIGFAPSSPVNDTVGATRTFNVTINQTSNVTWYINGTEVQTNTSVSGASYTNTSAVIGVWNVTAIASNTNGTAMQTWIWNVTQSVAGAPSIINFIPVQATVYDIVGATRTFSITVSQTVDVTWYINGTLVQTNMSVSQANYTDTNATLGTWAVKATAVNTNGTTSHEWIWNVTPPSELPPDPCTVAPSLDSSVATSLANSTKFLYTGSNPIQTGVAPGTIDEGRVAVLRGLALTREGTPLSGVNISILAHPEYGRTMSRADGMFDMAVNGGGLLTVKYEKAGYLSAQRKVQTSWQDYAQLPNVVLIQADDKVTTVDLTSNAPIQVARGSPVTEIGEAGLPGWNITLMNDTGAQIANASTDANGFYQFTNLTPGIYFMTEQMKKGWTPTNATFRMVILNSSITNLNFRNRHVLSTFNISGFKINDANGNGVWDAGESGLSGWNITLMNAATFEMFNTTTDANGFYKFTDIDEGNYTLIEETKAGWTPTNTSYKFINLNEDITNLNFTNKRLLGAPFNISGFNINDSDGNGVWDPGESGLSNWTIVLTNTATSSVFNATTDANGFYKFTDLINGNYIVTEVPKPGWKSTNGTSLGGIYTINGTFMITIDGQDVTNVNFTNQRVLAKYNISGFKINDSDSNGAWDPGETGLSGWNITLMNATGTIISNTSTDANGFYQFMNLTPDIYIVTEEKKAGWIPTNPTDIYAVDGYAVAIEGWRAGWTPTTSKLIILDNDTTNLNFTNQIASGGPFTISGYKLNETSEINNTRQATLMFPQGIQANMTLPNGTTQALTSLHIRASEYTVGASGPNTMPAELPPTSGYTYAVDLSADESAGAADVSFNRPVYTYVENFLNFSVGSIVPVGYYNRTLDQWTASNNGLVIKILNITGGTADLDIDGSGKAANTTALAAINITDAERQQLATLYQLGQSLWRVPITHFSQWDFNWPFAPRPGAKPPNQPNPQPNKPPICPDQVPGSIIGCENQELGESVDIAGTPFSLQYQSDRVPGRKEAYTLDIPLSGESVPAGVKRIDLEVLVSDRHFAKSFLATPNQSYIFTWDGKDACGNTLQGQQPVTVRIGYVYDGVYLTPSEKPGNGYDQLFAHFSYYGTPATGDRTRQEVTLWQEWKGSIGVLDSQGQGLGGWSLSVHHAYDPIGKVLYFGNGQKSSSQNLNNIITTVAGNGIRGFIGDNGSATQAQLNSPQGVALGSDGSLYIADNGNERVRRVGQDGIIKTVAGGGNPPDSLGDSGPATQAQLNSPQGVAVGSDGSLYIADSGDDRIRRVGPDGIITTVAGNGTRGYGGDGSPATQAQLNSPQGISVGSDGSIYIADNGNDRIRRVGPDGIITTVAGNGICCFAGDGGPATQAQLDSPQGVSVGSDGSLYIADNGNDRIRRVKPDGIITTAAGNGNRGFSNDLGPATQAQLNQPWGIVVGQDNSLYISDNDNSRIRKVILPLPGLSATDLIIPSEDGSEIYVFNSNGRHLRTLDALTGSARYQFGYDSSGKLVNVTDGDGSVVTIQRDAGGNATTIASPYGQRTSLSLNAKGHLTSITNPAGESNQFSYTDDGLLINMTDPRGYLHNFSYDSLGRLIKDEDPAGGFKTLNRTDFANGYSVTLATGLNRNTTYQVEQLPTGDQRRVNTLPSGLKTETIIGTNGVTTNTVQDGTYTNLQQGPDPRFGMQTPVSTNITITTPGGLTQTIASQRTATLANPNDPLSLQTLTETTNINSQTFTSAFNASTRRTTSSTPLGRTVVMTVDNKSRIVQGQVPGIVPINFTYDSRGRRSTISRGTRTYSFSYDAQNNLANVTDPLSRSVGFGYDSAGRVIRQTLPDGRKIQYAYDASGNVIAITPPGRPSHAFNYTPVDLIKDYTPPDIGIGDTSTRYTYNIDRQLTNVTRPDGATINLGYDSAGRLSMVNYPQGTKRLSYNTSTGSLKNITSPDGGSITYAYDGSLLTDTTWSGTVSGSVHRTYDNNFRITSESVNGTNTVNFHYDNDGLLTQAGSLNLSSDPMNGTLNGSAMGNITDTIGYSGYGEMAAYQAAYSGTGIFSVNYTRDDLGSIVQKNETIGGASHTYAYMYDQAGRLVSVSKDGVMVSQYVYDVNGNRLSYTSPGGTISGTYDNQDRLLQYGTTTYTYTANGELQSKTNGSQTTAYQYDALDNLRNVTLPDGMKIEYIIDGQDRRIGKKVNGVLVQGFLYKDGLRPIAELDGADNVVSRFIYASDDKAPDYMVKGGSNYRIISDHLGSPRLVVDIATGTVVQRVDYDEFGNVTLDTNPGFQPFGFAGGLYDRNTKLVRFGLRDYDSEIGRWTSKDPINFHGQDTNLFTYVLGDPINGRDPTGTSFYQCWNSCVSGQGGPLMGGAVGGALIGFKNPRCGVWVNIGASLGVAAACAIDCLPKEEYPYPHPLSRGRFRGFCCLD